jgi:hypothetical protein
MSVFSRTEAGIDGIEQSLNDVQNKYGQIVESQTAMDDADDSVLDAHYNLLLEFDEEMKILDEKIKSSNTILEKFWNQSQITDPDAQIYGPAMVKRIAAAWERWMGIYGQYEVFSNSVKNQIEARKSVLERMRNDRIAREEAERKRQFEEQQQKELEERNRLEEQQKQKEEELKRKAEEERLAIETEIMQRKEKEARQREEVLMKQQEEARLRREAELKARQEDEEKQVILHERKKAEEERLAKLSPIERSSEKLQIALVSLTTSCQSADLLVALNMLLKFLTNIISNPQDASKRAINVKNAIIVQRLLSKNGGQDALSAIGFSKNKAKEANDKEEEWVIKATAEQWNILVNSKNMIENEIKKHSGSSIPSATTTSTFGASSAPTAAASPSTSNTNPLGLLSSLVSPPGGIAGVNPMAYLSDPFFQNLMASPRLMQIAMSAAMRGTQPSAVEMMNAMSEEIQNNPHLLSSLFNSPLVQQMMSNPGAMNAMMGSSPVGGTPSQPPNVSSPQAGTPTSPLANLFNPTMQQSLMNALGMSPSSTASAGAPANPPSVGASPLGMLFNPAMMQAFAPFATGLANSNQPPSSSNSTSTSSNSTAPDTEQSITTGTATSDNMNDDEELSEEALLQQAILMSTQQQQPPKDEDSKKDPQQ